MNLKLALEILCHRISNFAQLGQVPYKARGCPGVARKLKTKLLVLVHIWTTFPMVKNIAGLLSQIVRKLCHCIPTSLALQPAPGNPPEPWFSFSIPLICPPLFNNQPLSFFSSRRVHLSQIAHGRSPICKSICPPSFSISHIHCTCTPHLLCVWK